jgi:ubiquinone/menaquinone biosynthesis C-methylase UbiE
LSESNLVGARTDTKALGNQYKNSSKLQARANLHIKYGSGEPWWPFVARTAALPAGAAVLDLGCGPGWMWDGGQADFPPGLKLTLADISQGMVDEALARVQKIERYSSVEGQVADASALPFADGSFDAVLACHMLYHVPDPRKALDEIGRVLKPGGIAAVTTNDSDNLGLMYELGARAFGGTAGDPSGAAFDLGTANELMRERFEDVTVTYCPGGLAVTEGEALVDALTSYPPGDGASEAQVSELRRLIAGHISAGNGIVRIPKLTGMVRGIKR